ncbi:MAG: hypothetical protein B6I28_06140 [Fusobacteriia bacterium 4572_132]|nr:MAG: hypothetical protein B6I28_06140 [Fusobacteriia bacterium 4572_132]
MDKISFMKQDRLELDIYDIKDFDSYNPMDLDAQIPTPKYVKKTKLLGTTLKIDEMYTKKIDENIFSVNFIFSFYNGSKKIGSKFNNIVLKSEKEITKEMILDITYKKIFPKL